MLSIMQWNELPLTTVWSYRRLEIRQVPLLMVQSPGYERAKQSSQCNIACFEPCLQIAGLKMRR